MSSNQKYYFFVCYHCGQWHFAERTIKVRKCWKCNRSFQFEKAIKFSRSCSGKEAVKILKQLKSEESTSNFKNPVTMLDN